MAKIISSLPGSTSVLSRTSQLINDGSDNTSAYVETDELGTTAFSNNYNDLNNLPIIGDGITNLAYTTSPTQGIVTSDTGSDAIIPLADDTNAGLLEPSKYTILENTSGTNTGDQDLQSVLDIGNEVIGQNNDGTKIIFIDTTAYDDEGTPIEEISEATYGADIKVKYTNSEDESQEETSIKGGDISLEYSDGTDITRSTYLSSGNIEVKYGEAGLYFGTSSTGNYLGEVNYGAINFISTINGNPNSRTILIENPESIGDGGGELLELKLPKHTGSQTKTLATTSDLLAYAPSDSPTLTGTPTAPTAAPGTNDDTIANAAFVQAAVQASVNGLQEVLDAGASWTKTEDNVVKTIDFSAEGLYGDNSDILFRADKDTESSRFVMTGGSILLKNTDSSTGITEQISPNGFYKYTSGGSSTETSIDDPVANTTLKFPAKTAAGNYTINTTPDTTYTVSTLPSGVLNDMAIVTDATAPTYLGALTGGGAVVCPVWHNGTIWVAH